MVIWFDSSTRNAGDGQKSAIRSLQAWQYLIAKAANRQTVKYDELRELMGYTDNRPLGVILGNIMFYCQQHNIPSLSLICVNRNGVPGDGFTAVDAVDFHTARERVFEYPWFKMKPPSVTAFQSAREKTKGVVNIQAKLDNGILDN